MWWSEGLYSLITFEKARVRVLIFPVPTRCCPHRGRVARRRPVCPAVDHAAAGADGRPGPASPSRSPSQLVWAHLKRSLANLTKHTIAELTALVKTRLRRMQHRPGLLVGFLASTNLEFGPFL